MVRLRLTTSCGNLAGKLAAPLRFTRHPVIIAIHLRPWAVMQEEGRLFAGAHLQAMGAAIAAVSRSGLGSGARWLVVSLLANVGIKRSREKAGAGCSMMGLLRTAPSEPILVITGLAGVRGRRARRQSPGPLSRSVSSSLHSIANGGRRPGRCSIPLLSGYRVHQRPAI